MNNSDISNNAIPAPNFPEDFAEADQTSDEHDNKEHESPVMDDIEALNSALKELGLLHDESTQEENVKKSKARFSHVNRSRFTASNLNQWKKFKNFVRELIAKVKGSSRSSSIKDIQAGLSEIIQNLENIPIAKTAARVHHTSLSLQSPLEVFPSFEHSHLSVPSLKASSLDQGKEFVEAFKEGGKLIATERIDRADTIDAFFHTLMNQIDMLKNKLTNPSLSDENKKNLEDELSKLELALDNALQISEEATWASTNSIRYLFSQGRDVAKKQGIPILPNLRIQTITSETGEVLSALTRSGAISDFRNGEVSLQELQDYLTLQEFAQDPHKEISKELASLYGLNTSLDSENKEKAYKIAESIKFRALIAYGIEDLVSINHPQLSSILENYIVKKSLTPSDKQILASIKLDPIKLQKICIERRSFLQNQVLQDLFLHLTEKPASHALTPYGRVALLDPSKKLKEEKGFIFNEKTQFLDMKAIFDQLDKVSIIFDLDTDKGPYFDEDGFIHMPKKCSQGIESTTLDTYFFNFSVQGHTLNQGLQAIQNADSLEKFERQFGERPLLKKAFEILSFDSNLDPFEVASLTVETLATVGGYMGVNCFGGKDRTGYLMSLLSFNKINEAASKPLSPKTQLHLGHRLLKGGARHVALDNAGHADIKVTRFNLKLFGVHSIKGKLFRLSSLVNALFLGLKAIVFKQLSESDNPKQLYKTRLSSLKSRKIYSLPTDNLWLVNPIYTHSG